MKAQKKLLMNLLVYTQIVSILKKTLLRAFSYIIPESLRGCGCKSKGDVLEDVASFTSKADRMPTSDRYQA